MLIRHVESLPGEWPLPRQARTCQPVAPSGQMARGRNLGPPPQLQRYQHTSKAKVGFVNDGLFDEMPPRAPDRLNRVLELLLLEWQQVPDERFFQFVSNLPFRLGIGNAAPILEDGALIEMLTIRAKNRAEADRG